MLAASAARVPAAASSARKKTDKTPMIAREARRLGTIGNPLKLCSKTGQSLI